MLEPFNPSKSLTALEQGSTVIAVIEMSQSKWLVAAVIPGIERQPLKKIDPDEEMLLKLLHRWQNEAGRAGREIKRIVVAYEAGRDGFWLARWLRARGIETYVIHPTSVAVSREHRRAKTDRLDTELSHRGAISTAFSSVDRSAASDPAPHPIVVVDAPTATMPHSREHPSFVVADDRPAPARAGAMSAPPRHSGQVGRVQQDYYRLP